MQNHVILWILCLCIVAFLNGAGLLPLSQIIVLAAVVASAALVGAAIAMASDALLARRQHQLMGGRDSFSSVWNGTVLAISSICMALMLNSALQDFGWTLPYAMVILCPLSAACIWLLSSIGSGQQNKLKLKLTAQKSPVRATVALVLFGLALGVVAEVAVLALGHLL